MLTISRSLALPKRHARTMILATATAATWGCSDEVDNFTPSATISPDVLSFGEVSVDTRQTLPLTVQSDGSAAYQIVALNLDGDERTFAVEPAADLLDPGVRGGQTSTISVTYTPCPDAWDGDQLRDNFDFTTCPTGLATAVLNGTDNTETQSFEITLSGTPVQPPSASLVCPSGIVACGETEPSFGPCQALNFGARNATQEEPCDILVELRNAWRDGAPVGTLVVDNIELRVREINDGRTVEGQQAGFTVLDRNRQPLNPSASRPIEVPIQPGSDEGAVQFWVRFTGAVNGTWRGQSSDNTGLRLQTNDPDNPTITAPILAVGTTPDITVFPDFINFEDVVQGTTKTSTAVIRNDGDSELILSDIEVRSGSSEFQWSLSVPANFPLTIPSLNSVDLFVTYAPTDAGADFDFLDISSNDPDENPFGLELRGGAQPNIEVNPSVVLEYPITDPPEPDGVVQVCNGGGADLILSSLDLEPVDEEATSLDDFEIVNPNCPDLPCDIDITLCPPENESCATFCTELLIRYSNNDQSSVDEVNLVIGNNDPGDPNYRLALRARDNPCRFPQGVITVETRDPCARQVVRVNGTNSTAGGRGPTDTIERYIWSWLFARSPIPTFSPLEGETTTFIPSEGGTYILGLELVNSCGVTTQSAATETILVRDSCE